jgi:acetyl-CoA carboxylase biotin carboxyl carrier protein
MQVMDTCAVAAPAAAPVAAAPPPAAAATPPPPQAAPKAAQPPAAPAVSGVEISAPMSGTVYRRPAPGEPLFVKEGDKVAKGQSICIIEARLCLWKFPDFQRMSGATPYC